MGANTLKQIKGLGFSTITKILYFKRLKVDSYPALIFDQKVINAINSETRFEDYGIEKFQTLKYDTAVNFYVDYLSFIHELSIQMQTESDKIEMFLFEFGSNLKEPIGEDGDWDDL